MPGRREDRTTKGTRLVMRTTPSTASGETLVTQAVAAFSRYQEGDRSAFDALVEVMTPLLWRTVRGAGLDQVAAEDVVQTVWLTLLRSAGTIRDPQSVVGWLLTAARREAWRVSKRSRTDSERSGSVFGIDAEEVMDLPDQREPVRRSASCSTSASAGSGTTCSPCRSAAASSSAWSPEPTGPTTSTSPPRSAWPWAASARPADGASPSSATSSPGTRTGPGGEGTAS